MRPNRISRALLPLAVAGLLAASPAAAAPARGDAPEAERQSTLSEIVTDVVLSIWERVRDRLDGDPPTKTDRTPGAGIDPDGWRPKGG